MNKATVGVFWVIGGKVYAKQQKKDITNEEGKMYVKATSKIDSDFEHYVDWDNLCGKSYPHADFATYPRLDSNFVAKQGLMREYEKWKKREYEKVAKAGI